MTARNLYIVVCGAPLASRIADGVREAQEREWNVAVIPTDAAMAWIDTDALSDVPVITGQRDPGEANRLPPADAIAVVPATFNTINAWATGLAHTYPLATLCAGLGAKLPIVAVPFAKHDLAGHPAWLASLAVLRYAGVTILDPSGAAGSVEPVVTGTGDDIAESFHWSWVLNRLDESSASPPIRSSVNEYFD